jgi:succinate dehydrogenase assembly factor 1
MSGGARKLSGLQKEVLSLYRTILREAVKKDRYAAGEGRLPVASLLKTGSGGTTTCYAREEFRRQAGTVRRSDFKGIEYRLRKGHKQVKLLRMPGVIRAHFERGL